MRPKRLLVVAAAVIGLSVLVDAGTPAEKPTKPKNCIPASECCKVCSTGKACGNSCISRKYTCHKGRGCACDSSEVC